MNTTMTISLRMHSVLMLKVEKQKTIEAGGSLPFITCLAEGELIFLLFLICFFNLLVASRLFAVSFGSQ